MWAPLIPNGIIHENWDLTIAFAIGLAFGYILEQAGFSSSRKLAGVFYGYDFVVLRVFFTAAVTAMTGLIFFDYFGILDSSALYINPTFLMSAIVGGVIMGLGFITGGYCPGTGIVAAAVGKIDAIVFGIGIIIGIFIFAETFPYFKELYTGNDLGAIFVFDSLGMSRSTFAVILIVVALVAFMVTAWIEKPIAIKHPTQPAEKYFGNGAVVLMLMILAVIILFLPEKRGSKPGETKANSIHKEILSGDFYVSQQEAIYSVVNSLESVQFIDVRDAQQYESFHLPAAMHVEASLVSSGKWRDEIPYHVRKYILYSNGTSLSLKAWMQGRRAGINNIFVLQDGLNGMLDALTNIEEPSDTNNTLLMDKFRFLTEASERLQTGNFERKIIHKSGTDLQKNQEIIVIPGKGGC